MKTLDSLLKYNSKFNERIGIEKQDIDKINEICEILQKRTYEEKDTVSGDALIIYGAKGVVYNSAMIGCSFDKSWSDDSYVILPRLAPNIYIKDESIFVEAGHGKRFFENKPSYLSTTKRLFTYKTGRESGICTGIMFEADVKLFVLRDKKIR